MDSAALTCTAFEDNRRIVSGSRFEVAVAVRACLAKHPAAAVLIFDDDTGRQIDLDLRGTERDLAARFGGGPKINDTGRGPGRPKLGVVAREVTLLPRHWEWLGTQPGGASVALRRLVESARTTHAGPDARRRAQEAADHFMMAMAGNLPHYEEAARALYAGEQERFTNLTAAWPADLCAHARKLAANAFSRPRNATAQT